MATIDVRPKIIQGRERPAFKHKQHTQKAFDVLNQLRRESLLCDVVLVAAETEIPAHKVVLSSCTSYFYAMFTQDLAEAKADRITLQEIDPKALVLLIDFIYTSEIHVTEENVQTLLPAANILQMTEVRDACCDFLQSQLHPSNCLGIQAFSDLHACTELKNYAQTYTEQHYVILMALVAYEKNRDDKINYPNCLEWETNLYFRDVVHYDEFLSLPCESVCKLISSDRLTVITEEQVYEAVISWVQHDISNREQQLSELLENVRFPLMTQDYLVQKVEEEQMIKTSSRCKDFLIEAMKYHLLKTEQKAIFKTPRTLPRTPLGLPKVLLVIGGQAPKAIRSVECFDFKEERWYQLAEMPTRRCRCGVAVVNGLVHAVGGFNGSLRVRTVDVYDPVKDIWSACPSMEARRSTLGVSVLNGLIYAVGGFDGSSGLDTAECYDIRTGEWRTISNMSTRRSSVGVGVVNGMLFAVGGYDGASRQCLSSVECFNPLADKWMPVRDMSCRRSGAGVGVVDGILYAVGGHDGPLVRKSVEMYDPEHNEWKQAGEMHLCRRNAGVVSNGGYIYVVGGDDGSSNLASVECYDPKTNLWTLLSASMMTGRSYAGVTVIDKPVL